MIVLKLAFQKTCAIVARPGYHGYHGYHFRLILNTQQATTDVIEKRTQDKHKSVYVHRDYNFIQNGQKRLEYKYIKLIKVE